MFQLQRAIIRPKQNNVLGFHIVYIYVNDMGSQKVHNH
jgi:hypothetical protein